MDSNMAEAYNNSLVKIAITEQSYTEINYEKS